jgi:glc operon protein GlcG
VRTRQELTHSDAEQIAAGCISHAVARGLAVSVAVVDSGGFLWQMHRMDGAGLQTAQIAEMKARTAALARVPTAALEHGLTDSVAPLGVPNRLLLRGGLPIFVGGLCIGGVGVSGVRPAEDEEISQAGLEPFIAAHRGDP